MEMKQFKRSLIIKLILYLFLFVDVVTVFMLFVFYIG